MTSLDPQSPTVVIVAYHFWPSPEVGAKRMTALASALRADGKDVSVFSAFQGLDSLGSVAPGRNDLAGYRLFEVADPPSRLLAFLVRLGRLRRKLRSASSCDKPQPAESVKSSSNHSRSSLRQLILSVLHTIDEKKGWAFRVGRKMLSMPRPKVIVVSGPPMSSVLAAVLAGRALRCPVIVDLRDPIFIEYKWLAGSDGVPVKWGRRALERYVLKHAAGVVTTSPTLSERLRSRYPSVSDGIECILNGFDQHPSPKRSDTGNRLVVIYAGTLYLNRNPFPFFEALDALMESDDVDSSRIEVLFVGDCERYGGIALADWLAGRPCGKVVTIQGPVSSIQLQALYERATLLLNFAEGQRMQVPAKTFELLALGRELLVLCEPTSDTAAVVQGIEGASCVASSDQGNLLALLHDIYMRHVQQGTLRAPAPSEIQQYSRETLNVRFVAKIDATIRAAE